MSVRGRLGAYGLVLVGLFAAAYAVGEQLPGHEHTTDASNHTHDTTSMDSMDGMGDTELSADQLGLASSADGYRLVIDAHDATSLAFHLDHDGAAVTAFTEQHEALLHLLLVQRDLSGFQHLHPTMSPDGTWRVDADLAAPGAWRVVADSRPTDATAGVVLGIDLVVPGDVRAEDVPAPVAAVTVDGLTFHRDKLRFTVSPTTGLAPYLGQPAHLVAFRVGDLAYVHLHPTNDVLGDLRFVDVLPGPGTYRLFLQVQHDDHVVTAPFTVVVDQGGVT